MSSYLNETSDRLYHAFDRGHLYRVGRVGHLRHAVHYLEHPLGRRKPLLDIVVLLVEPLDRLIQQKERGSEGEEVAWRRCPVDNGRAAVPDNEGDGDAAEHLHDGRRQGLHFIALQDDMEQVLVLFLELALLVPLHRKRLHYPLARDRLVEEARQPGYRLLVLHADLAQPPAECDDGVRRERKDDKGDDRQLPVPIENNKYEAGNGKCVLQDCREGVGHRPLDEADIVRDAGDDLARGRFVEEGERLGLEAPEDEVPYIGDDLLAHEAHKIRLEVIENALREVEERDAEGDQHQQCGVLLEEDLVHDGLDEVGGKPVRRRDEGHEYHGEEKLHPVRLDEFEESQVKCHVFILSGGGLLRPRRSMGRGPERRDDFAGPPSLYAGRTCHYLS